MRDCVPERVCIVDLEGGDVRVCVGMRVGGAIRAGAAVRVGGVALCVRAARFVTLLRSGFGRSSLAECRLTVAAAPRSPTRAGLRMSAPRLSAVERTRSVARNVPRSVPRAPPSLARGTACRCVVSREIVLRSASRVIARPST
ncbi:MAG: hypothetical protein LOD94_14175, partial [Gammaproteobacteria bacterium]